MLSVGVEAVRGWLVGATARKEKRVLPPLLRRPARFLMRLEWRPPRHLGLKGLVVFLGTTAVVGMVLGGHTKTVTSAAASAAGLAIDQVKITGQSETSEVDILGRLDIGRHPSLFTFDLDAARERVETLPWVAQATLRKLYPDTLEVTVMERLPYALWQHGETVFLIDPQGTAITDFIGERYTNLPLVVGPGANDRVDEFLDLILSQPTLLPRVRAGVLISNRRWNIVLGDAVEIMLPENDPSRALARIAGLDAQFQLLSRDIVAVDLRSPDRLVVRLSERGVAEHQKLIEVNGLQAKKGANT